MEPKTQEMLKEALELPSVERAGLADHLLSSLDSPDKSIDDIWRREVGERLKAYEAGRMETVSVQEVLAKYKKK